MAEELRKTKELELLKAEAEARKAEAERQQQEEAQLSKHLQVPCAIFDAVSVSRFLSLSFLSASVSECLCFL